MKITDVQSCVIGREEPHSGGCIWTFVRIYTDAGLVGTGECSSAGSFTSGFATRETVLALKKFLLGQDPINIGPLYETMRRHGRYAGGNSAPMTFALTGIENALYDIVGKALGVPLYQLLGGKYRDSIRLYADCHAGETNPQIFEINRDKKVVWEFDEWELVGNGLAVWQVFDGKASKNLRKQLAKLKK